MSTLSTTGRVEKEKKRKSRENMRGSKKLIWHMIYSPVVQLSSSELSQQSLVPSQIHLGRMQFVVLTQLISSELLYPTLEYEAQSGLAEENRDSTIKVSISKRG